MTSATTKLTHFSANAGSSCASMAIARRRAICTRSRSGSEAGIPLAARPSVAMIAPLGDRVRLYALITYEASGADVDAALKAAEDRRKRMSINYETLK